MGTELMMGKKPASYDRRDLKFRDFLIPSRLPTPPAQFGFGTLFPDWRLGNGPDDSVQAGFGGAGDCVFAGADHETMLWNKEPATRSRSPARTRSRTTRPSRVT